MSDKQEAQVDSVKTSPTKATESSSIKSKNENFLSLENRLNGSASDSSSIYTKN